MGMALALEATLAFLLLVLINKLLIKIDVEATQDIKG
jgi:hypothetical protein